MSHIKRLTKEIANYTKNFKTTSISDDEQLITLEEDGAYLYVNMQDITKLMAMVIGPKGTSYEDGFYVFSINVTDKYPFEPPQVQHLTTDGKIRINPNLYERGKVCLSILGTWSGPAWSSLMNIGVVLNYLRMIMNEDPLRNEPGYSNPSSHVDTARDYNDYVDHENMRYSILTVHHINKFPQFKSIIHELYEAKRAKLAAKISSRVESTPPRKVLTVYNSEIHINWSKLMKEL